MAGGRLIVLTGEHHTYRDRIRAIDPRSGETAWEVRFGKNDANICFLDDRLIVVRHDTTCLGLDSQTGERRWSFPSEHTAFRAGLSPDRKTLLLYGQGEGGLVNLDRREIVAPLPPLESGGFCFSPDGRRVAVAQEKTLVVHDCGTGRTTGRFPLTHQAIRPIAFLPGNRLLLSDGIVEAPSGETRMAFDEPVADAHRFQDGRLLVVVPFGRTIRSIALDDPTLISRRDDIPYPAHILRMHDAEDLYVLTLDKQIWVLKPRSLECVRRIVADDGSPDLSYRLPPLVTPDDRYVVACTNNSKEVFAWRLDDGCTMLRLDVDRKAGPRMTRDGRLLFVGGTAWTLRGRP
jgi:hypothetical protein